MDDLDKRSAKREFILECLEKQIKRNPKSNFIISSEHLSSRLTDPEELSSLSRYLLPLFESIKIVIYIRKPLDTAISSLSTEIKSGEHIEGNNPLLQYSTYISKLCMHKEIINLWSDAFGKSNIVVKLFNKKHFTNGDLLQDFAKTCSIFFSSKFHIPTIKNASIGYDGLQYLSEFNRKIPEFTDNKLNPFRSNIVEFFETHFGNSEKYAPTSEELNYYCNNFRESDEWVKTNFFSQLNALWGDSGDNEYQQPEIKGKAIRNQSGEDDAIFTYLSRREIRLIELFADAWESKQKQILLRESDLEVARQRIEYLNKEFKISQLAKWKIKSFLNKAKALIRKLYKAKETFR